MKKSCICAILLSLCFASFALAGHTVPSQIKEVTVFSGQALVKREAVTPVQKGLNELDLEIETFRVDSDSVMAKVFGAGEIFSVQFKEIPTKESPQEGIKVLEQEIEELERSKRALSDQKKVVEKKETFLGSLIDFSKTEIPKEVKTSFPNMEDINKTLLFLGTHLQNMNKEKLSLDTSIVDVEKEIRVLKEKLVALRGSTKKGTKVIEILFNAEKEQQIRIEAQYLTRNANWEPLYKVSVPVTLSEMGLSMFSKIWQKTGEDWKNVSLSVSNVIPLRGARLPSLSSWVLDIPRPHTRKVTESGRFAVGAAMPAMEAPKAEDKFEVPEEEAAFAGAVKTRLPLSFEYRIPKLIDIESRDKETILPLFTKKLQGDFYHYAVPKQSPLTFLVCKAEADKELLSGNLNVYFGGQYVGKTYLSEKKAGEEFYFNLGADREIVVKQEKIRDRVKETFLGKIERGTVVRALAYKIKVENLKDRSVTLKLIDNIPVSKTDKIEVKNVKISPQPAEKDYLDNEGVMLWEYTLNAQEEREIDIEFVVTYPKDLKPLGI